MNKTNMTKTNRNQDTELARFSFNFDKTAKGGESLILTTKYIANGDPITESGGVYINQTLTLHSYCNSASFDLYGIILTPEVLRELANKLESARNSLIGK